jgi:hypothetical protein
MPFNTLLITCLIPGTSFKEPGCRVRVEPESGETVLFFAVDDQSNPNCAFRRDLGLSGVICDLVVFYARGDRRMLCLVELKRGSDVPHAVEQIVNTRTCLCRKLGQSLRSRLEWRAYIMSHGSAHKETKQYGRQLEEAFGKGHYRIAGDPDLGKWLRI